MIPFMQIKSSEETFSHIDKDTKKATHVALDRLRFKFRAAPTVPLEVDHELAQKFYSGGRVPENHVKNLVKIPDEEFDSLMPLLALKFKNDTWVLAWGETIYVSAHFRGRATIKTIVCQRQDWAPFIIKGFKTSEEILAEMQQTMALSRAIRGLSTEFPDGQQPSAEA